MTLEDELRLKKPITPLARATLVNIYYAGVCLKKKADAFFRSFGLSDVQFNVMMLLAHQADGQAGLSQARLSEMMLVNRANITSLIDRMERAKLVCRSPAPGDRRYNIIKLTAHGSKLLAEVEPLYMKRIKQTVSLTQAEQKSLIRMLEKIREQLS